MAKRIISASAIIDKSSIDVYKFVTDLAYYPYWNDVISIVKVSGSGEVGTIYNVTKPKIIGKSTVPIEIARKEMPLCFAFLDKSKAFASELGFKLSEEQGKTKVQVYHRVEAGLLSGFFGSNPITGSSSEEVFAEFLEKLKSALR